jgi:hypothetical protein
MRAFQRSLARMWEPGAGNSRQSPCRGLRERVLASRLPRRAGNHPIRTACDLPPGPPPKVIPRDPKRFRRARRLCTGPTRAASALGKFKEAASWPRRARRVY